MSDETMTDTSAEIEEYCSAVRTVLEDLPSDVRDDLLDDLPDHLREVLAEGEGSLRDRLGDPAAYADELRAAAGVASAVDGEPRLHTRLLAAMRSSEQFWRNADTRAGRALGYSRFVDLVRALAPGWWVLRGWIAAELICGVRHYGSWTGFVPYVGNNRLVGGLATLALVIASIAVGRRTAGATRWPRLAAYAVSVGLAVWAVAGLGPEIGQTHYAFSTYVSDSGSGFSYSGDPTDLYPYDQNGNPLTGVRLYDQDGNPVQVGSDTCQNGNPAPGVPYNQDPNSYSTDDPNGYATAVPTDQSTEAWSYPLCPSDVGPFRSGPGAVPNATTSLVPPTNAPSSSMGSSAVSPASSSVPTASPTPTSTPAGATPTSRK